MECFMQLPKCTRFLVFAGKLSLFPNLHENYRVSGSFKSHIATGLSKIGLYDKRAAKIGLRRVNPSDIFVVSFPKSGNTWVRFLLANMLAEEEVTMKNINDYVAGIYNFRDVINSREGQRFIKTHDPFFECYPKSIYVYRDYRDVVVSYYHYQKGTGDFNGTMQEFLASDQMKTPFGTWQEHVKQALAHRSEAPESILFVGFEELLRDPLTLAEKMASFSGIVPKHSMAEVVERSRFERLQVLEETHGKVFETSGVHFFRAGSSGQWKTELTEEDLKRIVTEEVKELLHALNLEV